MSTWSTAPGQLEQAFVRAARLRVELLRKEQAISRRVQTLARGLADLMEPGEYHHRRGVGLHAFDVDGTVCLAAAYLEDEGDDFRYRYAVLCGGEAAKRALRSATLDPGDSDEPGPRRRITLAIYADYDDFVERLPAYSGDVARGFERRIQRAVDVDGQIRPARRRLAAVASAQRL